MAAPTEQSPVKKMRKRANGWRDLFIIIVILGLIGSYLLARSAGTTTDYFGTTTHDSSVQAVTFIVGAVSSLLFGLPFLGFSHVIDGQADLYES